MLAMLASQLATAQSDSLLLSFTDAEPARRSIDDGTATLTHDLLAPTAIAAEPDPVHKLISDQRLLDHQLNGDAAGGDLQREIRSLLSGGDFNEQAMRQPRALVDPFQPGLHLPPAELILPESPPYERTEPAYPLGFSGRSSIYPSEEQNTSHFIPVEDRWRVGFGQWDRYDQGHPIGDDYPYVEGAWCDPYNQNVLKGDYPLVGQHTFLKLQLRNQNLFEGRQVPTPTTPFEATRNPGQNEFFGDPDQYMFVQNNSVAFDLFHGDAAFKPADWRLRLNMIYNLNHLVADEFAVVTPDVRDGTSRFRQDFALEEWFYESKLADLSPHYDFVSARVGSQPFTSDFRGFVFSDINRGVRLFGNRLANRDQYNVIWFDQTEKETNSLLNTYDDRHQNTLIANYYRQDFIWPGYTTELSYHFNNDKASFEFDRNRFLVRPDPVGVFAEHRVKAHYLGWAGNGHINRFNVSHATYYVLGEDELNPLAGEAQTIHAWMGALELSYDRDWMRFRCSYFYSSGDKDITDNRAEGFDAIFDNPNFAGGEFSYWNRQAIRLFGVNLTNRLSLVPNLRNSKFQSQTNFVNPGLHLVNVGIDSDLTPKTKLITNANYLWFNETEVLETYVFQGEIRNEIGLDLSAGIEYRPLLNNNILIVSGVSGLLVGKGFRDLYQPLQGDVQNLGAGFLEMAFEY